MAEPWKVPPQAPPNFNWTPESMIAETQSIIDNTRKLQKTLIASMAYQEPTFNNLILPLAEHDNQVSTQAKDVFLQTFLSHLC
jgi:hypothetical protein